jgi:small-conductance mechanosensitive channel
MGIGFLFGSLLLHHKGIPLYIWIWQLRDPHIEMMIFGWTIQFVMGIAFFILPRFSERNTRYGAEHLGWWSFYLINAGVALTALADWYSHDALALIGRILVFSAIVSFSIMIYPRVKPLGGFNAQ